MNTDKTLASQEYREDDREKLKGLLKEAMVFEETTLASGKKSHYYLDARLITLSSVGALLVSRVLLNMLQDYDVDAIGGMTMGADPIVSAVAVLGCLEDMSIDAFIVRKQAKEHGRQKQVEGPSIKGKKVVIVDDVVTSGGSLLQTVDAAQSAGAEVVLTTCLVDRQEGAKDLLDKRDLKFEPVFTVKELL